MTWNHRVVKKISDDGSDEYYSIQEVYYDDEGKPYAQTIDLQVEGDTVTEIRKVLEQMLEALDNPVMDEIQDASVPFPTSDDGIEGNWEEGQKYIYESPDGGKTIYRRKFNDYDNREQVNHDIDPQLNLFNE